MKKIGVLFIFLFVLLIFLQVCSIRAQDITEDLEGAEEQLEEGLEKVEDIKETIEEKKWDYLGKEWTKILLENRFVSAIDSFLTKISIVFVIFFGEPYSLSFILLGVIVLWFYFFFKFSEILTNYSSFSTTTSMVLAFAFTMIFAQFKIFKKIVEFFGWLIFWKESSIWRFVIILVIFILMIGIYYLSSYLGKRHKKQKEEDAKKQEKIDRSFLRKIADMFSKALGNGEK